MKKRKVCNEMSQHQYALSIQHVLRLGVTFKQIVIK